MQVKDIMHKNPAVCFPETTLKEVAQMMLDYDCGSIPVVDAKESMILKGIITDRDITCRTIAKGENPLQLTVRDCMTSPAISVTQEMSLETCCRIMEDHQVRRVPVVDYTNRCCGVITQAHIAKRATEHEVADVLRSVSQKSKHNFR